MNTFLTTTNLQLTIHKNIEKREKVPYHEKVLYHRKKPHIYVNTLFQKVLQVHLNPLPLARQMSLIC